MKLFSSVNERQINEVMGWRRLPVWLLSVLIRTWLATLRYECSPEQVQLTKDSRNGVFMLWHNRIFTCFSIHRRFRSPDHQLYALVSASRDGAWLTTLLGYLGVKCIRGSSSRRGAQSAIEILKVLKEGGDVGITLDGPRGPLYQAHPGAALIAQKHQGPILYFSAKYHRALRLRSWDRMFIPYPFSTVEVIISKSEAPQDFSQFAERSEVLEKLVEELNKVNRGTDPENGL